MVNLRWFRKHQKIMLVVFGVGLMVVFVLTAAVPYMGSSGSSASREELAKINQTIVEWNGGKLARSQLRRLLELHHATMIFQDALVQEAFRRSPQGPLVGRIDPIPESSAEAEDRAIFARFFLAQYAKEKLDMVVSDDAVYDFLHALSNSDVSQSYFVAVCRKVNPHIGYNQIHEYLKMELAAMRYWQILSESFFMSQGGPSPANVLDTWQAFLQNELQIECAVEEFKVKDFLPQVTGQPTNAELRRLFDEGRFANADSTFEEPGFKQPRRVKVEYVSADASAFMELAIQDVTPEQVLAEYNRLVEVKDPLVMEPIPTEETPKDETLEGEKMEDDAAPPQQPPSEKSDDPAPNPENAPQDPAPEPPAGEAPKTDEEPPADPPSDSGGDSPGESQPAESDSKKDDGGGGAGLTPDRLTTWVAYHLPRQESNAESAPQETPPAEGESAASSEAESSSTQDAQPPAGASTEPALAAPQDAAPAADPGAKPDVPQDETQDKPQQPQEPVQRPKKLDSALEKAVKQRLKREEVIERMTSAIEKVRTAMTDYALARSDHESTKNLPASEQEPLPNPLDLQSLASENHLKYGVTALCNYDELALTPVGVATEFLQNPNTGQFETRRAAEDIFDNFDRKQLFTVDTIQGLGSTHLLWLTEKVDSQVPSFEDAQEAIVDFWKHNQAVELALNAAKKVRDEIQTSGSPLVEVHKETAQLTGAFRWLQGMFEQVEYGTPQGVKNPGEEFMSAAFNLKPNELAVALNSDRSAAYVIQLISADPRSMDQLRDQYLDQVAAVRQVIPSSASAYYNRRAVARMINAMYDELGVEWVAY